MTNDRYVNEDGELANMAQDAPIMLRPDDATALESGTVPDALKGVAIGTMAYTAGYKKGWQLDTDGETWVQFVGGA